MTLHLLYLRCCCCSYTVTLWLQYSDTLECFTFQFPDFYGLQATNRFDWNFVSWDSLLPVFDYFYYWNMHHTSHYCIPYYINIRQNKPTCAGTSLCTVCLSPYYSICTHHLFILSHLISSYFIPPFSSYIVPSYLILLILTPP